MYFDDLDAYGMVHHAKFAVLLDRAFSACFSGLGLHLGHEDGSIVVRGLTLTVDPGTPVPWGGQFRGKLAAAAGEAASSCP